MQVSGGYRYPSGKVLFGAVLAGGLGMAILWWYKRPTAGVLLVLGLGILGSIFMACAFTAVGLLPPQGNVLRRIEWFLKPQFGTTVQLNQPLLYVGLVLVLAALLPNIAFQYACA